MIKTRIFPEHNYKAIWYNGKTIRIALDNSKPITELDCPEFYDVKLTGKCEGNCSWCYMDSKETDNHYDNVLSKIESFFEPLSKNERPFQVAIGGGEPTSHPDFIPTLKLFKQMGIEPNYTTNGMWIKRKSDYMQKLLEATREYCGGVAVSCHPHLKDYWRIASKLYLHFNVKLNFHIIISDKESIDYFKEIYDEWKGIEYFVLLPYGNQGRAKKKEINWQYLIDNLPKDKSKIAFGANFYPYLKKGNHDITVSLYEPEIMSKFLDLKDMKIYKSSFETMKS
jgi:organic radical activating enzyme